MAFYTTYKDWQRLRKLRKDGDVLVREAKRGVSRYKHQLSDNARTRINGTVETYEAAVKTCADPNARTAGSLDAVADAVTEMDKALDDLLSFARKSMAREYIEAIGTAVLIALILRAFVVEAFKIPSGSMIPTLQVGDHIFVNKFIYGVRVPGTNIKIGKSFRKPRRGEVIVFIYPKDQDKDFIKRIVAVEGDTVQMKDGVLYVNNEAVPHRRLDGDCTYDDFDEMRDVWAKRACTVTKETVNGVEYTTYLDPSLELDNVGPPHNTLPVVVPPHSVFCEGDNRDNSHDSRMWGEVPEDLIKGKAMVIWWSQGDPDAVSDGPLSFLRNIPIAKYVYGARFERMFQLVH